MKGQSNSTNRVSKTRRISYRIAKKLGESYKIDGSSTRSHEETVQ